MLKILNSGNKLKQVLNWCLETLVENHWMAFELDVVGGCMEVKPGLRDSIA
jgi:hypothetical protein